MPVLPHGGAAHAGGKRGAVGKWARGEATSPEMDASFERWKAENREELEKLELPDGFGGRSIQYMLQMCFGTMER